MVPVCPAATENLAEAPQQVAMGEASKSLGDAPTIDTKPPDSSRGTPDTLKRVLLAKSEDKRDGTYNQRTRRLRNEYYSISF